MKAAIRVLEFPTSPCEPDAESFGTQLAELRPRMLAVAQRYVRDVDVAHDVVQNATEKALRHRDQFAGRARLSTWFHRIVANEALMWLRSERRRAGRCETVNESLCHELPDPAPGPSDQLAARRRVRRVEAALATLGADERDVVVQCLVRGRSYQDYGAERGIHAGAAKSRAFRARRRLARTLGNSERASIPA